MKKTGILIGLCIFFLCSSCLQNSNNTEITERPYVSSSKKTELAEVTGQVSERTHFQTDFSEPSLGKSSAVNETSKFINAMENLSISCDGMLYDFDFDNIPEIIFFDYGMDDTFYNIFKFKDGEFLYLGLIRNCDNYSYCKTENSAHIDMYYDKNDNEYFYCSNSIEFVKNNYELSDVYGFYQGDLYKYEFKYNDITTSTIVSFKTNSEDEETFQTYLQNSEKYLSQFKKIQSVVFEPLWSTVNIKDETYKDIIAYVLENNYNM